MTLGILASVMDDFVHACIGFGRFCAFLHRLWTTWCILASVLDDFMHSCIGFKWLCAFLHRLWSTMCILASVLEDYVHNSVGFGRIVEVGKCMRGEGGTCPAPPRAWKNKNESISKNAYVYFTPKNRKESISKNTFVFLPPISFFLLFFLVSKLLFPTYY